MEFADSTEVIVEDKPRSKINRKLICALLVAVVVCLLLLVVCLVLAVLYSQEVNKPSTETKPSSEKPEKYEICDDAKCFHLGQELVTKMNKSVDPCEDFYAYACGGWQRRLLLINITARIGDLVNYKNILALKKSLDLAHVVYSKNDAVMKLVRVYNSCLNTTAIDALGLQPLNDLIKEYGGWSISQNYDPKVTVAQRIGRAARELDVDSLFGMDVGLNKFNSSITVLMLKESALGLNKRDYWELDDDSKKKRKEYIKYMKDVSRMFNVSYAKMKAIYDFEVKLAKIVSGKSPEAALNDYIKKIAIQKRNRRSTGEETISLISLSRETRFPWPVLKEFLDILFNRKLTGYEKVYPVNKAFFKEISVLYKETDHALLADYIMWQVIRQYVGALPDQYRSSTQTDLLGLTSSDRWTQCIQAMFKPFDMPLGLLYVNRSFNDATKSKITEMIENVRASFIQKLPTQTWMDKETQEMARKKALAIAIEEIGYPSYIKDPARLKAQYESLNVSDSLMDNLKAANHYFRMRTLKNFERPLDKKEWFFGSPADNNGFYAPFLNKIIFLAGILQKPMYNPDSPRYLNYGGIGLVIGHEITHGFDGRGRLYDKNGNVKNWWSAPSAANFDSKSKCFVKQYDKYEIFDKHANGSKTLNENIADNGGIKLAYDAYQRWTKVNGTEKILPGLDLNPNQLFFLGFAQSWCSVLRKEGAYTLLDTDNHSTGKYSHWFSFQLQEVFRGFQVSTKQPHESCE